MFKEYESKPIKRMAYQLKNDDVISEIDSNTFEINGVIYKAYQKPVAGDYVVRLTDDDTYHVSRDVFRDRNIVGDEDD